MQFFILSPYLTLSSHLIRRNEQKQDFILILYALLSLKPKLEKSYLYCMNKIVYLEFSLIRPIFGPMPPCFQLFKNSGNCVNLGPMIRVPEQNPQDNLGEF